MDIAYSIVGGFKNTFCLS